jgi:uncharacterized glyoxalase superfamily protein PhnB
MSWLSPYLTVKDVGKALEFYQKAFGFTKRMAMTDDKGVTTHAEVQHNDAVIMFGPEGGPNNPATAPATAGLASPVTLYLYVEDTDAQYRRAVAAGAKSAIEPMDAYWGDRMCKVIDPDGHAWMFATYLGKPAAAPA